MQKNCKLKWTTKINRRQTEAGKAVVGQLSFVLPVSPCTPFMYCCAECRCRVWFCCLFICVGVTLLLQGRTDRCSVTGCSPSIHNRLFLSSHWSLACSWGSSHPFVFSSLYFLRSRDKSIPHSWISGRQITSLLSTSAPKSSPESLVSYTQFPGNHLCACHTQAEPKHLEQAQRR